MIGTVKWFNEAKGYGFIKATDGADFFLHASKLADPTRVPGSGAAVEFSVELTPKGATAIRVRLLAPVGEGA